MAAQQHRPTGSGGRARPPLLIGAHHRERAGFMNMKLWLILAVTLLCTGISHAQRKSDKTMSPALEPQLKKLFADKRVQVEALAKEENKEPVPEVWDFFAAGEKGDWTTVASLHSQLRNGALLGTMVWQP